MRLAGGFERVLSGGLRAEKQQEAGKQLLQGKREVEAREEGFKGEEVRAAMSERKKGNGQVDEWSALWTARRKSPEEEGGRWAICEVEVRKKTAKG
jgi:hypothetical protein